MRNMAMLVAVAVVALALGYSASYAQPYKADTKESALADAGNTVCPVSGESVDGKSFFKYKGKRYGLCCPMCEPIFANDPEKYAAIADKEAAGNK